MKYFIFKNENTCKYIKTNSIDTYTSNVGEALWDHIPEKLSDYSNLKLKIIKSDDNEFYELLNNAKTLCNNELEQVKFRYDNTKKRIKNINTVLDTIDNDDDKDDHTKAIEYVQESCYRIDGHNIMTLNDVAKLIKIFSGKMVETKEFLKND